MAQAKTREELIRLSWLTELRRQGHRKCTGQYYDQDGGVCALGLLREVAGIDANEDGIIAAAAGLSEHLALVIVQLNDGDSGMRLRQYSFAEIANVVEKWFGDNDET
jgi:hypothetical protein